MNLLHLTYLRFPYFVLICRRVNFLEVFIALVNGLQGFTFICLLFQRCRHYVVLTMNLFIQ